MDPYVFAMVIMLVSQGVQSLIFLHLAPRYTVKRTIPAIEAYLRDPGNAKMYSVLAKGMLSSPATHEGLDTLVDHIGSTIMSRVKGSIGGRMKSITTDMTAEAIEAMQQSPEGAQALIVDEIMGKLPSKTSEKLQGLMQIVQLFQNLNMNMKGGQYKGSGGGVV